MAISHRRSKLAAGAAGLYNSAGAVGNICSPLQAARLINLSLLQPYPPAMVWLIPPKLPSRDAIPGCESLIMFRSEEHTSELQSRENLVCRLLLEKKNNK